MGGTDLDGVVAEAAAGLLELAHDADGAGGPAVQEVLVLVRLDRRHELRLRLRGGAPEGGAFAPRDCVVGDRNAHRWGGGCGMKYAHTF